jgi:subtilase family serine protease
MCKKDRHCLFFWVGLVGSVFFSTTPAVLAQDGSSLVIVQPMISVNPVPFVAPQGLVPRQVATAYGFDQLWLANRGAGQTIAIVDAFDHPEIEKDLTIFNNRFTLPACTSANGCFQKIFATGTNPGPPPIDKTVWEYEIALDVEWAHAMAPDANILLVESNSDQLTDMLQAVNVAVQNGATVVSMSWGGLEFKQETKLDSSFLAANIVFVAASGDFGTGVLYPAASPYVTAVGGTTLTVDVKGNYIGETAWSGSGGGSSQYESEPTYQSLFNIPAADSKNRRGVPDVAYDADPNTGFTLYTTLPLVGWFEFGGTSAGAPQWAAVMAIADSLRVAAGKAPLSGANSALYSAGTSNYSGNYHDNTTGSNGSCGAPVCTAVPGYDYVTGLGSLNANNLANALAAAP